MQRRLSWAEMCDAAVPVTKVRFDRVQFIIPLGQTSGVSEWFLNGTSAQLGYTVPFEVGCCEEDTIVSLYAIAYRRWQKRMI